MIDHVNFWDEITEEVGGEPIEAIAIGESGWGSSANDRVPEDEMGHPISAEQAQPLLNYEHDAGYGGAECHAVYVWTPTRVIFVAEYDGSTRLKSVPRSPVACEPEMM